ncbi:type 4a pilus biogenesis protein PilO [Francisellaceae bacterium]|nr:type 4a pilus biogenesis protein PilO [Francisellaceae bacterium]
MTVKINEINLENIDEWPMIVKGFFGVIVITAIACAGYFFLIQSSIDKLSLLEKKEDTLKKELKTSINKTANLSEYIGQMQQLRFMFDSLLSQLPDKKEIPGLLEDITSVGLRSGLVFNLIRPSDGKITDFYETISIQIEVEGDYDQLGEFVEGIEALPRIVTIKDFSVNVISKGKADSPDNKLVMNITANTYRYLTIQEQSVQAKKKLEAKLKARKR